MAIVNAETSVSYMSSKLTSLFNMIKQAGSGPGGAPYIDARELAGLFAGYLTTPTYAFGQFTAPSTLDDYVVSLDFAPKLVLAFVDGATDFFIVKMRQMGTGTAAEQAALRFQVGGASAMVATMMSLRDEGVITNENAFTVIGASLVNGDIVSWFALG